VANTCTIQGNVVLRPRGVAGYIKKGFESQSAMTSVAGNTVQEITKIEIGVREILRCPGRLLLILKVGAGVSPTNYLRAPLLRLPQVPQTCLLCLISVSHAAIRVWDEVKLSQDLELSLDLGDPDGVVGRDGTTGIGLTVRVRRQVRLDRR
jgi:hypothetical protein